MASLMSYMRTTNYWATNHATSGASLPGGYIRILRQLFNLDSSISSENVTRALYLGAHATNVRVTHTNQLQAEKTTRTKHDQQAKIEDSCAEEFDTSQLKREKEKDAPNVKDMLAMLKKNEESLKKDKEKIEKIMKTFARDTG